MGQSLAQKPDTKACAVIHEKRPGYSNQAIDHAGIRTPVGEITPTLASRIDRVTQSSHTTGKALVWSLYAGPAVATHASRLVAADGNSGQLFCCLRLAGNPTTGIELATQADHELAEQTGCYPTFSRDLAICSSAYAKTSLAYARQVDTRSTPGANSETVARQHQTQNKLINACLYAATGEYGD